MKLRKYLINELIDIYSRLTLELDESYVSFIEEITNVNNEEDELIVRNSLVEYEEEILSYM